VGARLRWSAGLITLVVLLALSDSLLAFGPGARASAAEPPSAADSSRWSSHGETSTQKADSGPPLTSAANAGPLAGSGEEGAGHTPQGEADPLVSNGLGSPLCKGPLGAGELSRTSNRDCTTSGFVAAAAPTGNFGIDLHIDAGVLGVSSGGLLSTVQELFIAPLWMALVWVVHAVVVMLEWCFTIDLLDSSAAGGIGRGLRETQASFTQPWLAIVLSVASVLALYNGLIRRRVAETIGQVALIAAMIVGGMWVILDPVGTVGALGGWANRASLGTLAVAARGTPAGPARVLGESMDTVFAAAIEAPWCYMEFGNVDWCRDPSRLDPRLRAAALKTAGAELALIGCHSHLGASLPCVEPASAPARALEHSSQLLREAQSNGAIFLALPANGPARNSINEQNSLLRVLCQSSEATNCRGPTAAEAEFRTGGQTMARIGGLLLIAAGMLGMVLLLGFIALRLLAAAVFSLLYLLLAPAVVLAPALGESGRSLFRRWLLQLLGAVVAKLLYSFLLGVVLAVLTILAGLQALGWWTQWLLMSAFWWGAFLRRHQALGVADGAVGREAASRRSVVRRVNDALETRRGMALARWAAAKRAGGPPSSDGGGATPARGRRRLGGAAAAAASVGEQARRTLEREHRSAHARVAGAPQVQQRLALQRAQLDRVRRERARALAVGDSRRGAELGAREGRIERDVEREQDALTAARALLGERERSLDTSGDALPRQRLAERSKFLDEQAALPAAASARSPGERRDYRALAGLADRGGEEYERLDPGEQRVVRLQIDRELASRREFGVAATSDVAAPAPAGLAARGRPSSDGTRASVPRNRRDRGAATQATRRAPARTSARERVSGSEESIVMQDAREVAAGRKRQLGRGRQ
jgi:hypothetical protein